MIIRYPSGQVIPQNVQEALRYLGKVGFLSRTTWYDFFGKGKTRWQQDQLLYLVKREVLKPHSCSRLDGTWVLTESSIKLLEKLNWSCVQPIPPQYIEHDEVIANSLLTLERTKVCHEWYTERELRTLNFKKYVVQNKDNETKYPDAILEITFQSKPMTFALEYERTGKTSARYRSILYQYSKMSSVSLVVYIVESEAIKNRMQSAIKFLGNDEVLRKIAFVDAKEWKTNPLTATIQMRSKTITFEEIGSRKNT